MVDRLEALFHPKIRRQLIRANNPSMCDLETRFPSHHLDFSPPNGANQHETLLRAREAYTSAESEESRVAHDTTGLFQNLPAKSLLPRLITLRSASRPTPADTVIADQHDEIVGGDAEGICAMRRAGRNCHRGMPRSPPIAAIRADRKFFFIACYTISERFHQRKPSSRAFSTARVRSLTPIFERMLDM